MKWLPRSASESVFPSMIDTYFERHSPLTCVSFAPVTYVQTRHTSMFKGSLFGSLTTMNTSAHSRLEHPPRSVMVLAAPVPAGPVTETLCPCGFRPRSDHLAPPTHHHVQAHSAHVAPAHASPPPATAARSRTHRVLLPIPSRNPCVRSTRTAAVHTPALQTSCRTRRRDHQFDCRSSCAVARKCRRRADAWAARQIPRSLPNQSPQVRAS